MKATKRKRRRFARIINTTFGGEQVIEGVAELIRPRGRGRWLVRFRNGDEVERAIDPFNELRPDELDTATGTPWLAWASE